MHERVYVVGHRNPDTDSIASAIGIASLLVSMAYFAAGLLEKAKVFSVDAGAAMIWVFPLLCGVYGIAKMALTRRYL